jgi:serine/threonine protein kinase
VQGLQYIHSKQLVHLDIKPRNIFISLEYLIPTPPPGSEFFSGLFCGSVLLFFSDPDPEFDVGDQGFNDQKLKKNYS